MLPSKHRESNVDVLRLEIETDAKGLPVEPTLFDDRFRYDLVMVIPSPETADGWKDNDENRAKLDKMRNERRDLIDRLQKAGLKLEMFYSRDKDEIFLKVGAAEARLKTEADRIEYTVQLHDGDPYFGVFVPFHIDDPAKRPLWDMVKYYEMTDAQGKAYSSLFRNKDRFRLLRSILNAPREFGGASVDSHQLIEQGVLKEAYFVHDLVEQKRLNLRTQWANWNRVFSYQPVDSVRYYFGEDIALYFAWLGFYVSMLVPSSIFGLVVFLIWVAEGSTENGEAYKAILPLYTFFMALWASFFLELWKRYNRELVVRWGTAGYEERELDRFQFWGEKRLSPVTGEHETYFSPAAKYKRMTGSWVVIMTMIMVVVIAVLGIFTLKIILRDLKVGWLAGIINGIQIIILNVVYAKVALWLNNLENHQTDTEYRDNLISKTFLFQFVNSYNSLAFIAFVKPYNVSIFGKLHVCEFSGGDDAVTAAPGSGDLDGAKGVACMNELRIQLASIYGTALIVNNFLELFIPWAAARGEAYLEARNMEGGGRGIDFCSTEGQAKLPPYEGTMDDYAELVVQYGYVTLFVVSFPLAPLLALLNNLVEIRVDAMKIVKVSQRAYPAAAEDIGTWYKVLEIMGFIAVFSNIALLVFNTSALDSLYEDSDDRVWSFGLMAGGILFLKVLVDFFIPDEPEVAEVMEKRQQHIFNKYVLGLKKDEDVGRLAIEDRDIDLLLDNVASDEPTPAHLELGSEELLIDDAPMGAPVTVVGDVEMIDEEPRAGAAAGVDHGASGSSSAGVV